MSSILGKIYDKLEFEHKSCHARLSQVVFLKFPKFTKFTKFSMQTSMKKKWR